MEPSRLSNLVSALAAAATALACLAGSASGQYLEQRLTASDAAADAQFGLGVAVDGDTALVGASRDSGVVFWGGAVYVQQRGVSGWSEA